MKMGVGIFLAGVATAYLLDPDSGGERRAAASGRIVPVLRRLQATVGASGKGDTTGSPGDPTSPPALVSLKGAASAVQSRVGDAVSAVTSRAGVGLGPVGAFGGTRDMQRDPSSPVADRPSSGPDFRQTLEPGPELDPIPEGETNDPTLVARVESELFRDEWLPKGKLAIDAANGVVTVRGTLESATLCDEIVERIGAVEGVSKVVDLLRRS